jgi:hypothetical protein
MLFGKDENRRNGDVGDARSFEIEIPSGPGSHGFSDIHPELGIAEARAAERDGLKEEDPGMVFGRNGDGESLPASVTLGSDIERLAELVGRPSDPHEQELSPSFSDAVLDRSPEPETRGRTIMLVHHDERDVLKVDSFGSDREAQAFVEELLSRGVDRGSIEAYRASRLDFDVSFRPVVHFESA